ncbi:MULTISPECIES: hypothetical protein [unclassified Paraburkholderia]|uniref:hypothetical protein n=1 Tax=unclassified Paraburkholderia TaxID=2615204 RepID=UPI002AAFE5F9|nr:MULTISPECIES: hypothetical protein [unclassified Paraburkholderia]
MKRRLLGHSHTSLTDRRSLRNRNYGISFHDLRAAGIVFEELLKSYRKPCPGAVQLHEARRMVRKSDQQFNGNDGNTFGYPADVQRSSDH